MLEATGYSIDAKAFQTSLVNSGLPPFLHLTNMPMTMNGSEQSDFLGGSFEGPRPPGSSFRQWRQR